MMIFTRSRLMTVALTLVVFAGVVRIPMAKEVLLNESKFLGLF